PISISRFPSSSFRFPPKKAADRAFAKVFRLWAKAARTARKKRASFRTETAGSRRSRRRMTAESTWGRGTKQFRGTPQIQDTSAKYRTATERDPYSLV